MSEASGHSCPRVEIRPFGMAAAAAIEDVSHLHSQLLPASPVVRLGRQFMERFYYSVLPAEGHIFGAVAYVDSKPAGFITATSDSDGFMGRATGKHFAKIAWLVAISIGSRPARVSGLWEAWRIMRARGRASRDIRPGEILSVGVLPEYRDGALGARTGMHIAGKLLDHALEELRVEGAPAVLAVVDADNRRSRSFFEAAGFKLRESAPEGWTVPSVEYVKDLSIGQGERQAGSRRADSEAVPGVPQGNALEAPITVVVPCHNEEAAIPVLAGRLVSLGESCAGRYRFHYLFVDDGSTDATWAVLNRTFGRWPHCVFLRHSSNRGIAAAIMTGIQHAETETVCSIDCDCSYDPRQLAEMIPLLAAADMVTASPYHPQGRAAGVPKWRLVLSRGASLLHRLVAGGRLHTYTSCFRVYRRSPVVGMKLAHQDFLGIAEMLHKLAACGGRIVEYPATLGARTRGTSKVKLARTVAGHLTLLVRLLRLRLAGRLDLV